MRTTIRATEQTDVDDEVRRLRSVCQRGGLSQVETDLIASQAQDTLSDLVARGREIARLGSHMTVSRSIAGDGYEVIISFGARPRLTLIERVRKLLGR